MYACSVCRGSSQTRIEAARTAAAATALHRAGMEMQSRAGSRRFSAMTRIEALRALEECETQPKRPAEKMGEKDETKGVRNKERERQRCLLCRANQASQERFPQLSG